MRTATGKNLIKARILYSVQQYVLYNLNGSFAHLLS